VMWASEPFSRGAYGSFNPPGVLTSLRNPLDTQTSKPPGIAMAALLGEPAAPASTGPRVAMPKKAPAKAAKPVVPPPPPPLLVIEVINGDKRSEAKFVRRTEDKQ